MEIIPDLKETLYKCSFVVLSAFPYTVFKLHNLVANCMIVINICGKFKMTATQYISLVLKVLNIGSYLRI